MNILVTGANGQLGNEMRLVAGNSSDHFIFTDVTDASEESIAMLHRLGSESVDTSTEHLNITDLKAVCAIVAKHDIDIIVNCAAYTNVDTAETDEALAELINAEAPKNLAIAIKDVDGLLIHISTDYVFGKEPYNTPCRENQKGTPTGVYGATKLHGEQNILVAGCQHVILRTAWLYSEFGKNFCKTMLNLTATKPQLNVVFDQVGTPTYALDLANTITAILEDYKASINFPLAEMEGGYSKSGIYHYSNEGVCSWYDFTKMIARFSDNKICDIQPCHSTEFPSPVTRPSYSVLDKTVIKETFSLIIPYWVDSLEKCIKNLK